MACGNTPAFFLLVEIPHLIQTEKTALGRQMKPSASYSRVMRNQSPEPLDLADKCLQNENGGPSYASDHPDPTQALLLFQASTQSPSLKTGNTRKPSAGEWENYGTTENYSQQETGRSCRTPAICHLLGLMDTAWQGERAPHSRGSKTVSWFHSMICWRRLHWGLEVRSEWAAWGSGEIASMSCFRAWSDGTLCPCQEVQKCTLKEKSILRCICHHAKTNAKCTQEEITELSQKWGFPLSLGLCRWNCPLNCRTKPGAGHPEVEEENLGRDQPSRAKAPLLHEGWALMGWKGLVGSQGGSHSSPHAPELVGPEHCFEEGYPSPKLAG